MPMVIPPNSAIRIQRGKSPPHTLNLHLPKPAHSALQKRRGKRNHLVHRNLAPIGDPLAVKRQNGGHVGADDVLDGGIFFAETRAFFVRVGGNLLLHSLADIVKAAVAGDALEKIVLSLVVLKKVPHKLA